MRDSRIAAIALDLAVECFPLKEPFYITGHRIVTTTVVTVHLALDRHVGRGEASGVFYREGEDTSGIVRQIEAVRAKIEAGLDREELQRLLPPGGARNALDCAMWDLEAKRTGWTAWQIAGLEPPRPLLTTFTISANTPEKMARDSMSYSQAKAIKMKLTGEQPLDADRVRAVRAARPEVWLGVDANQGFTRTSLETLMPIFLENRVKLIEQPFRIGEEGNLDGWRPPIRIAADESAQNLGDLAKLVGRFSVVNIKLDKCGGLTEGLAMAREARRLGFEVMVGNMIGTSLAMAPAFLVGQLCDVVDLDGPALLSDDRVNPVRYVDGMISCPGGLWGGM
jgi:L-alanine-DL-glutamate epimerase-like enolase superfamily enzyme